MIRFIALSLLLGTLVIQGFDVLPSWKVVLCFIVVILLCLVSFKKFYNQYKNLIYITVAFLLGLLLASFQASRVLDNRLSHEEEGNELLIIAKIHSVPVVKGDGTRFLVDVVNASRADQALPLKGIVRLGWFQNQQQINAGETWQFRVKLKRPSGFMNTGGFDYEKWLFTQRIIATGYVRKSDAENKRLDRAPWYAINHWRQSIHQSIQTTIDNKPAAAVLSALLVAIRSDLSEQQWRVFQDTGTTHLIAISGLHIAVVAGFAFFPMLLLWRLFPRLNEKIPLRVAASFVGVLFATVYAILAGFTLPTQRALLMVIIALVAVASRRHFNNLNILAYALIGVILLDPLAAMTISFCLSFLAVALILFFINRENVKPRWWAIKLQLFLSLAMLPLSVLFFDTAPLLSPIANLMAIPWVSLLIVPVSLLALLTSIVSVSLSTFLFQLSAALIEVFLKGLDFITQSPLSSITVAQIPQGYLVLSFLGLLLLFFPKGFPSRWLGLVLMSPAFLFHPATLVQGAFSYTLLDVGQGYASVLRTQNHVLVYDTGTRVSDTFDMGKLVIEPFLHTQGIKVIDRLIISHEDIDHRGGADHLKKVFKINSVMRQKPENAASDIKCVRGTSWQWDGVNFEVLSPRPYYLGNDNNSSCVLKVWSQHHSLLLTGDIQKQTERYLLKNNRENLASDVMSVPHHGSKTSSSVEFIKAVSPDVALISAGYRSRFGHPKLTVIQRYQAEGIALFDTVTKGEINLNFPATEDRIKVRFHRTENQGFWHR